jgi:hypothetical protein
MLVGVAGRLGHGDILAGSWESGVGLRLPLDNPHMSIRWIAFAPLIPGRGSFCSLEAKEADEIGNIFPRPTAVL